MLDNHSVAHTAAIKCLCIARLERLPYRLPSMNSEIYKPSSARGDLEINDFFFLRFLDFGAH